jgi:MFS family permease
MMAVTTPETRNNAYAFASASRGLGTFVGTLAGGALPGLFAALLRQPMDAPGPYRWSILAGAAIGLAAIIPVAFTRIARREASQERVGAATRFPVLLVAVMIVHVYLTHGGWATCQAFANAYMDTALDLSAASIGLVASAGQFAAIFAPMLVPRLAARRSNGWTLMMAAIGTAVSLLLLALAPHWAAAGLGRLGVAVLFSLWMPALQVFQMENVAGEWRSLAYGAVSTAMAFSYASVSIAGGYIVRARGYASLFLLGVGLSVVGTAVMWGVLKSPVLHHPSPRVEAVRSSLSTGE